MTYSSLPPGVDATAIKPFKIETAPEVLDELTTLIKSSKIAIPTFENSLQDGNHGVSREWMQTIKEKWINFDWSKTESRLNELPNFKADIRDNDGSLHSIHFAALFSKKSGAAPIMALHGWPGSFLEFEPILQLLKKKYTPETLPYHVIVPSLPGYAFSSGPPAHADFKMDDVVRLLNRLMTMLGFEGGYIAQGGDIGARAARYLGAIYPSCKAVHVNFFVMPRPDTTKLEDELSASDKQGLARANDFFTFGLAYALEHATRASTIGFVLASSPIALMAWIGEKLQSWSDVTPSEETIIEFVTLYWITSTIERCLYPYREELAGGVGNLVSFLSPAPSDEASSQEPSPSQSIQDKKPLGFSSFPKEVVPTPESWVRTSENLVWFRKHDKGGHFAALEQPELLLQDIEDFVRQVWKA